MTSRPLLRLMLGCVLVGGSAVRAADAPTATAASSADADYAAVEAAAALFNRDRSQLPSGEALAEWMAQSSQQMRTAGLAFFASHPDDPRRWLVLLAMLRAPGTFLTAAEPGKPLGSDRVAQAAWQQELARLTTAALAAPDLPADVRADLEWRRFIATVEARHRRATLDQWAAWTLAFEDHLTRAGDAAVAYASVYLSKMEQAQTALARAGWQRLASSSHAPLRAEAERRLAFYATRDESVDFSFEAIDGRLVSMRQLRGKVVLLDFWATWCKPCVAQLSLIQRVYETYHDQGFEVIGISVDAPQNRAKLVAFLEQHPHAWPQLHDEINASHPLAKQFGVRPIPALFLIDQNGKIAANGLHGPRLEAEVQRLLKR